MIRHAYLFIFLGEFGYELLNWHAVARRLRNKTRGKKFYVASRAGMEPFYEFADAFYDISEIPEYKESVGDSYHALSDKVESVADKVHRHLTKKYHHLRFCDNVISSLPRTIRGLRFGYTGGIYSDMRLANNLFRKIEPVLSCREELETEMGFSLDEPYVLCQAAKRSVVTRDPYEIPYEPFLAQLALTGARLVLINFDTGRHLDSYSNFGLGPVPFVRSVRCQDFRRQSCLIHHAKSCVFFTEGDFRSHMYVPPIMGKNVHAVASSGVYEVTGAKGLNTAPIDFWNQNVFTFGGQIIPWKVEEITRDATAFDAWAAAAVAG